MDTQKSFKERRSYGTLLSIKMCVAIMTNSCFHLKWAKFAFICRCHFSNSQKRSRGHSPRLSRSAQIRSPWVGQPGKLRSGFLPVLAPDPAWLILAGKHSPDPAFCQNYYYTRHCHCSAEGEGRRADQIGAPGQGALHHREVRGWEAAAGAGQDQVPDPRPRHRGRAHQDHQAPAAAPPRPGILPPRQRHQPRPGLHANVGAVQVMKTELLMIKCFINL